METLAQFQLFMDLLNEPHRAAAPKASESELQADGLPALAPSEGAAIDDHDQGTGEGTVGGKQSASNYLAKQGIFKPLHRPDARPQ